MSNDAYSWTMDKSLKVFKAIVLNGIKIPIIKKGPNLSKGMLKNAFRCKNGPLLSPTDF